MSVPAQGRDGQYWSVSGTSPACALVAGVAALIKSKYPDLAPDAGGQRADLDHHATGRPAGYDSQVGFGIVDAAAALTKAGQLARGPARGEQHRGRRHVPRRAPAGAGRPARPRPADPVRAARAGLAGPDRRRGDPAGPPPPITGPVTGPVTGPGDPVTRPGDAGDPPPVDDFASQRAGRGRLDPARAGHVLRRHRRVPRRGPGPSPGRPGDVRLRRRGGLVAGDPRRRHPRPRSRQRGPPALPGRGHAAPLGPPAGPGRHAPRPLARRRRAARPGMLAHDSQCRTTTASRSRRYA